MQPEDRDRLMRIEVTLEQFIREVRCDREDQRDANKIFAETTRSVAETKAGAKGAWWTMGLFGTLIVATATAVSAVAEFFFHRGR